jgi:hypothetical protein
MSFLYNIWAQYRANNLSPALVKPLPNAGVGVNSPKTAPLSVA